MGRAESRWLCLLVVLLASACGGQRREGDLLAETLERYGHAIRWYGFERAVDFLDEERRRELAERPLVLERLRQYQVAGYRLAPAAGARRRAGNSSGRDRSHPPPHPDPEPDSRPPGMAVRCRAEALVAQ